jgi:N utilization substance protein A
MNAELLRLVDSIHRDKNIDAEIVFHGIESAILTAAKKHFGEEQDIHVTIDRETGSISATCGGVTIDAETLGRIAAQSAKQIMIQKIREAERDALYDEFHELKGSIVTGVAQRYEGGALIVNLGKTEAILPRGEQMPGETYHSGSRVRAIVLDVRKSGQRAKIVLSRTHPDFVKRLFEQEIPEVADRIIEIRAIAREAGYRTKVAVSSIDSKVDCVGACVGVRGNRIKNILDELGEERIDIHRYNESKEVFIPEALKPAQVEEVQIYERVGRAIVLVNEDQLSLAIGKRGQNVRLASKLVGIDIEIMTFDELTEQIERAESQLGSLPNMTDEIVEVLIEAGVLSFDDLEVMEPDAVVEICGVDLDTAEAIIAAAEEAAEAQPQEPRRAEREFTEAQREPESPQPLAEGPAGAEESAATVSEEVTPQPPTCDLSSPMDSPADVNVDATNPDRERVE